MCEKALILKKNTRSLAVCVCVWTLSIECPDIYVPPPVDSDTLALERGSSCLHTRIHMRVTNSYSFVYVCHNDSELVTVDKC
jgi:hypothetical protein